MEDKTGKYIKSAKNILEAIRYVTLATVTPDGHPWNSPVAHEVDENLNIYWFSDKQNQHSINIRNNPRVYAVIYDSTVPEGEGEGLYIIGRAYELSQENIDDMQKARSIKKNTSASVESLDEFLGNSVRAIYKFVPEKIWINDAEIKDGKFIRDFKVEIPLQDLA